jgi:hypothetical protein
MSALKIRGMDKQGHNASWPAAARRSLAMAVLTAAAA